MAEIFAIVGGVINTIQDGVCRRGKLKRSNWFFLHFEFFFIRRANVQKTIELERKGLLGFKIDGGNSPNDGYGNV